MVVNSAIFSPAPQGFRIGSCFAIQHRMRTRWLLVLCLSFLGSFVASAADVALPVLKVGSDVYSNVTVTAVTATHISFIHARGAGSVKLKNLSPELQKQFHYNGEKAGEAEAKQHEADSQFRVETIAKAAAIRSAVTNGTPTENVAEPTTDADGDLVLPTIYARSFRGERPPQIIVERWVTSSPPNVEGKFVLVDFWATWCGPCKRAIPHLNDLHSKFKDRLIIIGLSDESVEDIQKMKSPLMNYYVGTDTEAKTRTAVGVRGIPHALLMDPKGIVRYEGVPDYLTEAALERLMGKYSN